MCVCVCACVFGGGGLILDGVRGWMGFGWGRRWGGIGGGGGDWVWVGRGVRW